MCLNASWENRGEKSWRMIVFSKLTSWFRSFLRPEKSAPETFGGWLYEIEDQWSCEYGTSSLMMECGWPIDRKDIKK
jgi:hypothetical protein